MTKKQIYVADDDEDILQCLKVLLEWEGFEVITSQDGLSLMNLAKPPDLVILDISMNVSDGSHICYAYKQNPFTCNVPVVLVSADISIEEKAAHCGADCILAKPFNVKAVADIAHLYTADEATPE